MLCASVIATVLFLIHLKANAQDASGALNQANADIRNYFGIGINIMYAVGGIVGLIGAVKVYQKWSNGHPDTGSIAAAWFGACIFLVIVATALRSFFAL
jgi:hypothetical protein